MEMIRIVPLELINGYIESFHFEIQICNDD